MTQNFAVSFDYRCPFARNAQEAVVNGLPWKEAFIVL